MSMLVESLAKPKRLPKLLMACDQSVRGFAIAAAPTFWNGDWAKVKTARFDGGLVSRGDDKGAQRRFQTLYHWFDAQVCELTPNVVGFESYAFARKPDVHVVELVGACKIRLMQYDIDVQTVNQSSARKLLLAKVPRKGENAKIAVKAALTAAGAPANLSLDVTDALCVLNYMLSEQGALCYASSSL